MRSSAVRKSGLAAAAAAAVAAVGVPLALAAPTAAPPSDAQGYLESTARCASSDTAVIFGTTDTSRVAICETPDGDYQYRGVRVSDGARLIAPATKTSAGTFVAKNGGTSYIVTSAALSVTVNGDTVRTESWTDYHGPEAPAGSGDETSDSSDSTETSGTSTATSTATSTTTSAPTTTSTPSTSSTATTSATSGATTSATASPKPTTSTPLPPPLPAEVGSESSSG